VLALAVPFALFTPDDPLPSELPPAARTAAWTVFRGHPDYAWAWGTRFMVQLGNALGTLYLLYFLTDEVKVADPGGSLLVMILIYTAGMVATAVVGGRLSDKSGRRKIFVVWSGIVIALAAAVLAIWPNWPASLVASFLLGAGYGVFLAVDMALITQVLPAATDRAKDLGVINIATAAPSVIGPVIAAFLVVSVGGYRTLFAVTGAVTLLGAAMVVRIKSVP
jgi:MFS family permease